MQGTTAQNTRKKPICKAQRLTERVDPRGLQGGETFLFIAASPGRRSIRAIFAQPHGRDAALCRNTLIVGFNSGKKRHILFFILTTTTVVNVGLDVMLILQYGEFGCV